MVNRAVISSAEGISLEKSSIRVLLVDDYEPWRRFFSTTLQTRLNGIEAARFIREV